MGRIRRGREFSRDVATVGPSALRFALATIIPGYQYRNRQRRGHRRKFRVRNPEPSPLARGKQALLEPRRSLPAAGRGSQRTELRSPRTMARSTGYAGRISSEGRSDEPDSQLPGCWKLDNLKAAQCFASPTQTTQLYRLSHRPA